MAMAAASHSFKLLTLNMPKDSQDRDDILAYWAKSMIINMNQEYTTLNKIAYILAIWILDNYRAGQLL